MDDIYHLSSEGVGLVRLNDLWGGALDLLLLREGLVVAVDIRFASLSLILVLILLSIGTTNRGVVVSFANSRLFRLLAAELLVGLALVIAQLGLDVRKSLSKIKESIDTRLKKKVESNQRRRNLRMRELRRFEGVGHVSLRANKARRERRVAFLLQNLDAIVLAFNMDAAISVVDDVGLVDEEDYALVK